MKYLQILFLNDQNEVYWEKNNEIKIRGKKRGVKHLFLNKIQVKLKYKVYLQKKSHLYIVNIKELTNFQIRKKLTARFHVVVLIFCSCCLG